MNQEYPESDRKAEELKAREEKTELVLQRRKLTLDKFSEIVGCYQRGNIAQANGAVELAYWSAYNTLCVNQCLESVEVQSSFLLRDQLYDRAIKSHKIRAFSYWKTMGLIYQYAHKKAPNRDGVDSEERERTYAMTKIAEKQIQRLRKEYGSEGLVLVPGKNPIGILREIEKEYADEANNRELASIRDDLAYWGAKDVLTVEDCCLAVQRNAPMQEMVELDDKAYNSHHRRALAFWEAIHRFDSDNYGDISRTGLGKELGKEAWRKMELSHRKVTRLEDSLFLLNGKVHLDQKSFKDNSREDLE